MRHTLSRRELPGTLPTGPNPMTPLDEFTVIKDEYNLCLKAEFGRAMIEIDPEREVGFFEQGTYRGQFWLAGRALLEANHLLTRDVQLGLMRLGYEVA